LQQAALHRYNKSLVGRIEGMLGLPFLMIWKNLLEENNLGK
jgi:hypothetical protein